MIRLVVRGKPVTQGSHVAILPKHATKPIVVEGGNREARQRHRDWRNAVASEARRWMSEHERTTLIRSPLVVRMTFSMSLAASKPKHTRWWPTGKGSGDVDKLARAILDSMTGVLFEDDAQVVGLVVAKDHGDPPGVTIEVEAAPTVDVYGDGWTSDVNWRPAPPPAVAIARQAAERASA